MWAGACCAAAGYLRKREAICATIRGRGRDVADQWWVEGVRPVGPGARISAVTVGISILPCTNLSAYRARSGGSGMRRSHVHARGMTPFLGGGARSGPSNVLHLLMPIRRTYLSGSVVLAETQPTRPAAQQFLPLAHPVWRISWSTHRPARRMFSPVGQIIAPLADHMSQRNWPTSGRSAGHWPDSLRRNSTAHAAAPTEGPHCHRAGSLGRLRPSVTPLMRRSDDSGDPSNAPPNEVGDPSNASPRPSW